MVSIHMVGDKVVFYSYKINCEVPKAPTELPEGITLEETEWGKFDLRLGRYRVESDGIYADNEIELNDIKAGLEELGIPYTVTDIRPVAEQVARAREVEGLTGSPREALDYIERGVLPKRWQGRELSKI